MGVQWRGYLGCLYPYVVFSMRVRTPARGEMVRSPNRLMPKVSLGLGGVWVPRGFVPRLGYCSAWEAVGQGNRAGPENRKPAITQEVVARGMGN